MLQMLKMLHCPRAGFLNRRLATRQRVVAEFEWVLVNRFGALISAKSKIVNNNKYEISTCIKVVFFRGNFLTNFFLI